MNEVERQLAEERLRTIQRAKNFESLLSHQGWREIYALHTEWVEKARVDLRRVNTADHDMAINALQRWQIAENLLDLEANFINDTLAEAKEIQDSITLDDALLMEQLGHERSRTDTRTDPTGT